MSNFHKPKQYRSGSGCCICRAKSSSSRFTDSARYEVDFNECFKIREPRHGDICNACVLLVKRWKQLPTGSLKNWNHVVDAKAGHGGVSKMNRKKKAREARARLPELNPSGCSDDAQVECLSNESGSIHSSREASPLPTTTDANERTTEVPLNCRDLSRRRLVRARHPKKFCNSKISFLDPDFWKREKTCCGVVFKGSFGELLVDRRYLNPCYWRSAPNSATTSPESETIENRLECFEINCENEDMEVNSLDSPKNVSTETKVNAQCKNGFNENYAMSPQNVSND